MKTIRVTIAVFFTLASLTVGACGGGDRTQSAASGDVSLPVSTPEHHSKLAGAAVGAVVGHELGHHAVAGAVVGAAIQHHRNKKAAR